MTRRRFFPSSPAQALPGRTVELEMQLPKAAAQQAAAPAPVAVGKCTGWLVPWLAAAPAEYLDVVALPDGRTDVLGNGVDGAGLDYTPLRSSVWSGVPAALDGLGRARPVPASGFFCQEIEIDTTYFYQFPGRHVIAMAPGGSWLAAWDNPSVPDPLVSVLGHRLEVVGDTLLVVLASTDGTAASMDTLTATASMPGGEETQLILRARASAF